MVLRGLVQTYTNAESRGMLRIPIGAVMTARHRALKLSQLIETPIRSAVAHLYTDYGQTELVQPVKQDWRHSSGLEHDAMTTWRFRQFAGDRLRRRLGLALANHHAFVIENANMRLVH